MSEQAKDTQVGGDHYKSMVIQPYEYCERNGLSGLESFVVKYVSRHRTKNGKQDLEKAIHCLQLLIEENYPEPEIKEFKIIVANRPVWEIEPSFLSGELKAEFNPEKFVNFMKGIFPPATLESLRTLARELVEKSENTQKGREYLEKILKKLDAKNLTTLDKSLYEKAEKLLAKKLFKIINRRNARGECCGRCDGQSDVCVNDTSHPEHAAQHPDTSFIKSHCETCKMPFNEHGCGCD